MVTTISRTRKAAALLPVCETQEQIDTAQVVRQARAALQEARSLEAYVALIGELSLSIGRMEYWVDLLIPWAKFGEVYEQIAR